MEVLLLLPAAPLLARPLLLQDVGAANCRHGAETLANLPALLPLAPAPLGPGCVDAGQVDVAGADRCVAGAQAVILRRPDVGGGADVVVGIRPATAVHRLHNS